MNKFVYGMTLAISLASLAACDKAKDNVTPAASGAATSSTAPAEAAGSAAVAGSAALPQECQDYLNRAKTCFSKVSPEAAASFQQSLDMAKSQWEAMSDKSGLVTACQMANDQFSQQVVQALKCE